MSQWNLVLVKIPGLNQVLRIMVVLQPMQKRTTFMIIGMRVNMRNIHETQINQMKARLITMAINKQSQKSGKMDPLILQMTRERRKTRGANQNKITSLQRTLFQHLRLTRIMKNLQIRNNKPMNSRNLVMIQRLKRQMMKNTTNHLSTKH